MSTLLRIIRYTSCYKWRALTTFLLAVACTGLVLVLPAVTKEFTDVVIPSGQHDRIAGLAIGAILLRQILFTALRPGTPAGTKVILVRDKAGINEVAFAGGLRGTNLPGNFRHCQVRTTALLLLRESAAWTIMQPMMMAAPA